MDAPQRPSPEKRRESNGATALLLFALGLCAFGLVGIVALVLPQAAGLILVVAGFSLPIVLHYLIWGRMMSRFRDEALRQEREEERRQDG